jgi:hypothetical protein
MGAIRSWSRRKETSSFVVDTTKLVVLLRTFSAPFRSECNLRLRKLTREIILEQQLLDFALTSRPNLTRNPITAVRRSNSFRLNDFYTALRRGRLIILLSIVVTRLSLKYPLQSR